MQYNKEMEQQQSNRKSRMLSNELKEYTEALYTYKTPKQGHWTSRIHGSGKSDQPGNIKF